MSNAILLAGLGYGDEGKGSIVDYLCRTEEVHTVVRYNGGAQAAHNVCLSDGRHHLFAQFGSGMFVPGVRTHLSKHMLVNPMFLLSEARGLADVGVTDAFERLTVSKEALITNPFQVAANRLREMARDKRRHGSCGMGIGETVADHVAGYNLTIGDLESHKLTIDLLRRSQAFKAEQLHDIVKGLETAGLWNEHIEREWGILTNPKMVGLVLEEYAEFAHKANLVSCEWFQDTLLNADSGTVLFEGAQGVLLDQDYGTFPYVTRSRCTYTNAFDLLGEDFPGKVRRLGLIRSYMTRHGAGPFVTEDPELNHPEIHNCFGPWQEGWRQGHLDLIALDYAVRAVGGVDEIVLTHMDYLDGPQRVCTAYNFGGGRIEKGDWPLPIAVEECTRLQELNRVTEHLFGMVPIYTTAETGDELISMVEGVAGAPVTITSHGRTAEDKHARRLLQTREGDPREPDPQSEDRRPHGPTETQPG